MLERDQVGIRASGVNFGGVRQNGRDLRELPIAMRARAMWDHLPELIGFDGEFRATATCAWPAMTSAASNSRPFIGRASGMGLKLEQLGRDQLKTRYPWLSDRPVFGVLCPDDGHANPRLVGPAFGSAAQEAGATLIEHAEVTEGSYASGEFSLRTSDGRAFAAPVLVNCAGGLGRRHRRLVRRARRTGAGKSRRSR